MVAALGRKTQTCPVDPNRIDAHSPLNSQPTPCTTTNSFAPLSRLASPDRARISSSPTDSLLAATKSPCLPIEGSPLQRPGTRRPQTTALLAERLQLALAEDTDTGTGRRLRHCSLLGRDCRCDIARDPTQDSTSAKYDGSHVGDFFTSCLASSRRFFSDLEPQSSTSATHHNDLAGIETKPTSLNVARLHG